MIDPLTQSDVRHNWTATDVNAFYQLPFMDLIFQAQQIHRRYFNPNQLQLSTLMSIKTGTCPEDCAYCPQSVHFKTNIENEELIELDRVIATAKAAKERGASRFCMGAAWRRPPPRAIPKLVAMIKAVKELGLETCVTLGSINKTQAAEFKQAGLDYYNHNLDTSPEYYRQIITTRTYEERLETLQTVRESDIKVCCGGIIGMGESHEDRVGLLLQLANLCEHPQSVPINRLIPVPGTPLADTAVLDSFDFIRTVATARIMMPKSVVRLTAGRNTMSDEMQAWCFMAGANSIHYGETKLLTTPNPAADRDQLLLNRLGMQAFQESDMREVQ